MHRINERNSGDYALNGELKKRNAKKLTNYQLHIVITILDLINNNLVDDDVVNDYILDVNSLNLSMDCVDKADLCLAIYKLKKQKK
jgi:hypothetical protein